MKLKITIIIIFILSLLFYFFRLSVEFKNRTVALILNYSSFLDYYNNENQNINDYIDKLESYKIYNIYIYPSTIKNLLEEYNEISLDNGLRLNSLFKTDIFEKEYCYLVIPEPMKIRLNLVDYQQKFIRKNYIIYGFSQPCSGVRRINIRYTHKFEDILNKKGIQIIPLQNKPFLENIDSYLIVREGKYYLTDNPVEYKNIIKIHKFNKRIARRKDICIFINENTRGILERNVKGIMLHTLYYDGKIVKLDEFMPELIKKISNKGYAFSYTNRLNLQFDNSIIYIYRIIMFWLIILLLFFTFPDSLKVLVCIVPVFLLAMFFQVSLFALLLAFLLYYFVNKLVLNFYKKESFGYVNLLLYLGIILLGSLCISNFLFSKESFIDSSRVFGVKLIYLLPLAMWPVQYMRFHKLRFRELLDIKISLFHFILLNTGLILVAVLLLRSGNYYFPVSSLELKFRQLLEDIFFIRPRFKEMLFYPFLFILFTGSKISVIKKNFFIIYFFALIGISTTLNSFLHIHTLSYLNILRSLTGMVLGFSAGFIIKLIGIRINRSSESIV